MNAKSTKEVEALLARYRVPAPRAELRARVLSAAEGRSRLPFSTLASRWAVMLLLCTWPWAVWMEHGTAAIMAQTAASSAAPQVQQEDAFDHMLLAGLLRPRVALPLPPGYPKVHFVLRTCSVTDAKEENL